MKILEIKNNLVKISYDIDDNLALSGFVIIDDANCPYVAQVVSLKADSALNTAIVRLLFTFDDEGILKNYNGTIPSIKASISKLPSNELLDVLPIETPIKLGALAQQSLPLFVDKSIIENNLVVCCNKQENLNTFINNMLPQFNSLNQKAVVIDIDGKLDYGNKFEFGYDFKLPLNNNMLNYIFDHDLEDVDAQSKAFIQDIFYEVQEYSKTLPHQFIPFDTFLEVVDAQYRETNIPELILLKNKLLRYKEEYVFALNSVEITDLLDEFKHNNVTVLDISRVDGDLQKQVIAYIYEVMQRNAEPVYSIIKLDNYNASKKLIKRFLADGNIATTIICGHEFKYLQELKQVAQNFVFFAPLTTQHDFAAYNTYLAKLNPEEFVVYGDATQEIPLIVELQEFSQADMQPRVYYEQEDVQSVIEELPEQETQSNPVQEQEETDETVTVRNDDIDEVIIPAEATSEQIQEVDNEFEEHEVSENEPEQELIAQPEDFEDEKEEILAPTQNEFEEEEEISDEAEITTTIYENTPTFEDKEAIIENEEIVEEELLQPEMYSAVVEETSYENTNILQEELPQEINEEQIVRDVDEMFYNKLDVTEDIPPLEDDEEITEDDLDLIDNLNIAVPAAEGEETTLNMEPVIIEDADDDIPDQATSVSVQEPEETQEEQPIIPVYPANDIPETSTEVFEAGDQVSHPKYGTGVVEKMIKYGNKVLCSINFENIGRRLLDPAISEITKL